MTSVAQVPITRVPAEGFAAAVPQLAEVLVDAVEGGASVGFVLPFAAGEAQRWWATVELGVSEGRTLLWVARDEAGIVGTIQLKLERGYPNGRHRAEVSKLLVHRRGRGRGLGRALLGVAERAAADHGCTLVVLDTQTGSPAERLYRSAGWTELGVMPEHAADPWGELRPTTYFYKLLAR
jgi:GNAT superfamily N-acetyltransferase